MTQRRLTCLQAFAPLVCAWLGVMSLGVAAQLTVPPWAIAVSLVLALTACLALTWVVIRVLQWKPDFEVRTVWDTHPPCLLQTGAATLASE
jgi:hypothetical protein